MDEQDISAVSSVNIGCMAVAHCLTLIPAVSKPCPHHLSCLGRVATTTQTMGIV
jgi:hypothetical protein